MAVQFSLSYDANGDPVLVENTVTGTRKVVSTSPVIGEYKSRFESPASGDPVTDAEENQPDNNQSAIMDYIMEMEKGADADPNLSFIQKQNLEGYTPEAIEARKKEKTPSQKVVETVLKALVPYGNAASAAVKALSAILPEESEEIKAIKQFYADPEQAALVESIPGMSNYNLVYGNPFDPSYGLANAAAKRQATIDKTLARKYGLTPEEIAQTKLGTYAGSVDSDLIDRNKKLQDLQDKENKQQDDFRETQLNPTKNLTPEQKDLFRGGGADKDPPTSSAPVSTAGQATPFDRRGGGQDRNTGNNNQSNNNSGNTSSTNSSMGNLGFSDIRLKENVELIGKSPSNINIYKFNYKYNPTTYQGAMAHEVPWASVKHSNGYMMIDYNKIDVEFKKI